jgi:hypothetical protein
MPPLPANATRFPKIDLGTKPLEHFLFRDSLLSARLHRSHDGTLDEFRETRFS